MEKITDGTGIGKKSGQGAVSNRIWWIGAISLLLLIIAAGIFAYSGNTAATSQPETNGDQLAGNAKTLNNGNLVNSTNSSDSNTVSSAVNAPRKANNKVVQTPATSSNTEGNAYKGVAFKGLIAKTQEGVVGVENFKDNEAYVSRSGVSQGKSRMGGPSTGETITINLIVPKSKLQDLAVTLDGNVVIDSFKEEISGNIKTLTVNSYLPASRGTIQIYVIVGTRKSVGLGSAGDYARWEQDTEISQPLQGPQSKRPILREYSSGDDAYYKMNIAIRNYI